MPPRKLMLLMCAALAAGVGAPLLVFSFFGRSAPSDTQTVEAVPLPSPAVASVAVAEERVNVYVDGYAIDAKGFVVVWLSDGRRINWQRVRKVTEESVTLADGSEYVFRPRLTREEREARETKGAVFPARVGA